MSRDLTPLLIDTDGNSRRIRTIQIDEADAYMLVRALGIAINTAIMCGGQESVRRLQHYKEQIKALAPPAAKYLRRETDLCEIAIAASTAETWSIYRVRENSYIGKYRTIILIGNRQFGSDYVDNVFVHQHLTDMISHIIPLTCSRVEHDDEIVKNIWTA